MPQTLEQLETLEKDTDLLLSSIPFDCECEGVGTLSYTPSDFNTDTHEVILNAPIRPLYAVVPVDRILPDGILHSVEDELFIPNKSDDVSAVSVLSREAANVLVMRSMTLLGIADRNETVSPHYVNRYGYVRVFDPILNRYIGLKNVKVYISGYDGLRTVYTDENGMFVVDFPLAGGLTIFVEWSTPEFRVLNAASEQMRCYAFDIESHEFVLNLFCGEQQNVGTIWRVLTEHFYWDKNVLGNVSEYTDTQLDVVYRHEYNKDYAGLTSYNTGMPKITIWGLAYNEIYNKTNTELFTTTFHELAHAAMYLGCKHSGLKYSSYANVIKESWAKFVGWYMSKIVYQSYYGHRIFEKVTFKANGAMYSCDIPTWYNRQNMTQYEYLYGENKDYTPLFIDLTDDSNQNLYYQYYSTGQTGVYPDDEIVIDNPVLIYWLMEHSKNIAQLKTNLLNNADRFGLTAGVINNYFKFYGL